MKLIHFFIIFAILIGASLGADEPYNYRWLIFIAYLIGLSIGVHLLNLLCIPAVVYVVYFKKYKKITFKGFVVAGIISVALVGFIQVILIPGSLCFF